MILVAGSSLICAHNPLSARYHLEAGTQASVLTINLSQDGVNQALLQTHDRQVLEALPRKQFEELIVDYVKRFFSLSVNNRKVVLQQGGIKLGAHQTDLKFVLPAFTEQIEEIDVHIPAFKENDDHQTIFSYTLEGETDHVILAIDNSYRATVKLHTAEPTKKHWWLIGLGIFSGILLFLYQGNWRWMFPVSN